MKNTPRGEGMGGGFPSDLVHIAPNSGCFCLKAYAEELAIGNMTQTKQLRKICYELIG
jgi:hypothetical protein